jgi:hypothetical protein
MKTIEIIISPSGETMLQSKGFAGRECLAATGPLVEALGIRRSDRLTSEFYESERASGRLEARGEEG